MDRRAEGIEAGLNDLGSEPGGTNYLALAWRRKWLLLLLTGVGGALGYLYFLQCPAVYQSSAQLLIVRRDAPVTQGTPSGRSGEGPDLYQDPVELHWLLLKSPRIALEAIKNYQLASLPLFRDSGSPVGDIVAGLSLDQKNSKGSVIAINFKGAQSEDCGQVLTAVIEAYQAFLGKTYQNYGEETLQKIAEAKDELLPQLKEKEDAYQKFRRGSPLLWQGEKGANYHEARMTGIESERSQLMVQTAQTRARLEALTAALQLQGNREALSLLAATDRRGGPASEGSAGLAARNLFESQMFTVLLEEQVALEDHGPDHPKIQGIRRKRDFLREQLGGDATEDQDKPSDFLAVYLDSLREELKLQEARIQGLDALFAEEKDAARAMGVFQVQDETYRTDITRTQQLFSAVVKRLDEINLIKDYTGVTLQVVSAPGPGVQVAPRFSVIMGVSGCLGLLVGFGLAWLTETIDKSFRTPEEIRRDLGLPILGHIPLLEGRSKTPVGSGPKSKLSPMLCVAHKPQGHHAEAYRAVRTALYFGAHGHKVIQVTSPNPKDGKSTTATNLAISIAESGKKVLLIDADLRRPRIHKLLGLENTAGLQGVIADDREIADVVQPTAVENLWAITSGGRPANPAELLTSARFKQLLDVVKEQYDFVIVDTPPVLAVTDATVVAPRVDAVLLVVRLTKHARAASVAAVEMLNALGAEFLGLVVNGLEAGASTGYGAYSYRSYRYGYGGRYAYNYRDRYGYGSDDRDGGYYSDAESNGNGNGRVSNRSRPDATPDQE